MAAMCADCTACCQVFEVKEIAKAFGEPCKHLARTLLGPGCEIYSERPDACRHYVCLWLDSQRRKDTEKLPENLRPNVSGVVLGWPWGEDRETLYVYPLPGRETAWQRGPVRDHLQMVLDRGGKIVVVIGNERIIFKGELGFRGTETEFQEIFGS